MSAEPWRLAAVCFSIMVKRNAVVSDFDGNVEEFERRYCPAKNAHLFRIVCMSGEDLEATLSDLECAGLRLGRDVGVVDAVHGPITACEGIVFTSNELGVCWWADVAAEKPKERVRPRRVLGGLVHYIYGPDDEQDEFFDPPCRLVVDNSEPQAARDEPEWTILASRDASGALDCWTEHLGVRPAPQGLELGLLAPKVLGEIPQDWYDEDGDLLPEYADDMGELRLPDTFNGSRVADFDGEYLFGAPVLSGSDTLLLTDFSERGIQHALGSFGWPEEEREEAFSELQTVVKGAS